MPRFHRKAHRLPKLSYAGTRFYFLTLCTEYRRPLFSDSRLVAVLLDALREQSATHLFGVYAYCFMPDHLHLELVGLNPSAQLPVLVRAFKGAATARARKIGIRDVWQKDYYDHVLRSPEGLDAVASYVFNNPVRAGLVSTVGEWPFSGSFMFDWTKLAVPLKPFVPPWKKRVAR